MLRDKNIGFAVTGSFCTFSKILPVMEQLSAHNRVTPILSEHSAELDTRFFRAADFRRRAEEICGTKAITTIQEAEPIGPKKMFDLLILAPASGNTLAKINHGIVDGTVPMAVKSHIRNERPVIVALSTNDALGAAAPNIGALLNRRNFWFVPYGQDDWQKKPRSMVAHFDLIEVTAEQALEGVQIQPMIRPHQALPCQSDCGMV